MEKKILKKNLIECYKMLMLVIGKAYSMKAMVNHKILIKLIKIIFILYF